MPFSIGKDNFTKALEEASTLKACENLKKQLDAISLTMSDGYDSQRKQKIYNLKLALKELIEEREAFILTQYFSKKLIDSVNICRQLLNDSTFEQLKNIVLDDSEQEVLLKVASAEHVLTVFRYEAVAYMATFLSMQTGVSANQGLKIDSLEKIINHEWYLKPVYSRNLFDNYYIEMKDPAGHLSSDDVTPMRYIHLKSKSHDKSTNCYVPENKTEMEKTADIYSDFEKKTNIEIFQNSLKISNKNYSEATSNKIKKKIKNDILTQLQEIVVNTREVKDLETLLKLISTSCIVKERDTNWFGRKNIGETASWYKAVTLIKNKTEELLSKYTPIGPNNPEDIYLNYCTIFNTHKKRGHSDSDKPNTLVRFLENHKNTFSTQNIPPRIKPSC